eukprot:COSAG01_NODE_5437_length_4260_cov_27.965898_4_plen_87_part_00
MVVKAQILLNNVSIFINVVVAQHAALVVAVGEWARVGHAHAPDSRRAPEPVATPISSSSAFVVLGTGVELSSWDELAGCRLKVCTS